MSNFNELKNLPCLDLETEMNRLLDNNLINWGTQNQICINTTLDQPDDFHLGAGSLWYDWKNATKVNDKLNVPVQSNRLEEHDFVQLCNVFKNTLFEEVYNELTNHYQLGRVRLIKSKPKTCMTWHTDNTTRLHYPVKTQEGCFMVIEDEIKFLPKYTWWHTHTLVKHTAFNASFEERVHLVVNLL